MAVTQNTYTGDGSTVLFSFTFPYLETTDIKVSLDGSTTTAYTLANATTIQFNTAPANGAAIRIYRQTDDSALSAQFYPGSAIRSQDLNDNFTQNLYVTQEVNEYAWDNEADTIKSTQTWVSSNDKVATTAAIDARFQDELNETIESGETWLSDNDHIATTAAIDGRIDTAITNDIAGSDGVTITDDGDGTITVGLAANSVDLDRIKDEDIITYAEQEAGNSWLSDTRIPTTYAAARRFDTLVQPTTPTGSNWVVGKTWLQNDQDLTVSVWNGTNWLAVASGGAFTNQPKVVYVDATAGDDNNDGHRISRPKATIKAAIAQINADATYGDGSVVVVAPGVYQEVAPIDITKKDVSIIGTALRSCIVHPTPATETNSLFRVNSGTFLQNLTFTGVKASGARGGVGSVDPDATYGLPVTQGWNVSFYPGAMIYKSPYIQNCTNFSDSEINNANLNAHTPAGGSAGDTDSAVTGGGLLVDGAVVNSSSPLRSMVCDSYTHVGLDGPGILVTNNGYAQCTSSYAFFNHYHIKCLNGGQANLAASTTDFGRFGLIADGRSPNAIFTAVTTADAADQDITFTIDAPVVGTNWHGTATRPQSNMLVDIGGNTYPVLSAVANGAGWDVTISRPDPTNTADNLGLNGAVLTGAAVSFYLRSMVASSGHTMEYAGSGTNYSALPENGGIPVEANQVVELNNGKVWTAITDHNGKFKLGNFFTVDQQTSTVFVQTGSFAVSLQNLQVNPGGNAVIGANLDLNGSSILDSTGNVTIADALSMSNNKIYNLGNPVDAQDAVTKTYVDNNFLSNSGPVLTSQIFLDNTQNVGLPDLAFDGDNDTGVTTTGADELALVTGGTARLTVDSAGGVSITDTLTLAADPTNALEAATKQYVDNNLPPGTTVSATAPASPGVGDLWYDSVGGRLYVWFDDGTSQQWVDASPQGNRTSEFEQGTEASPGLYVVGDENTGLWSPGADQLALSTGGTGRLFVDASGNVEIAGTGKRIRGDFSNATHVNRLSFQTSTTDGPTAPFFIPNGTSTSAQVVVANASDPTNSAYFSLGCFGGALNEARINSGTLGSGTQLPLTFHVGGERMRITSAGLVGIGTSAPGALLHVAGISAQFQTNLFLGASTHATSRRTAVSLNDDWLVLQDVAGNGTKDFGIYSSALGSNPLVIDTGGNVGIGITNPAALLDVNDAIHCKGGIQIKTTTGDTNIEVGAGTTGNHNSYIDLIGDATYTDFGLRLIRYNTGPNAASQIVHRGTGALYLEAIDAGAVVLKTNGVDRLIAQNDGSLIAPGFYNFTTAGAANVNIAADFVVRRSTSSAKYKTNIETLEDSYADAILGCRPVWYRSTCEADNPEYSYWGFIAEEVEQIDPRLCHYGKDEDGNQVVESVQYDRFIPHLLNLIKRQQQAIETQGATLAALEAEVQSLKGGN